MKKTIMAFGSHPDDIEIGCGGAELKAMANGHEVIHVVLTSGEAGSLSINSEKLAGIREKEARKAAKALGGEGHHFFKISGWSNGGVPRHVSGNYQPIATKHARYHLFACE